MQISMYCNECGRELKQKKMLQSPNLSVFFNLFIEPCECVLENNQKKGPMFCPYCGTKRGELPLLIDMFNPNHTRHNNYQAVCKNCGKAYQIKGQ